MNHIVTGLGSVRAYGAEVFYVKHFQTDICCPLSGLLVVSSNDIVHQIEV